MHWINNFSHCFWFLSFYALLYLGFQTLFMFMAYIQILKFIWHYKIFLPLILIVFRLTTLSTCVALQSCIVVWRGLCPNWAPLTFARGLCSCHIPSFPGVSLQSPLTSYQGLRCHIMLYTREQDILDSTSCWTDIIIRVNRLSSSKKNNLTFWKQFGSMFPKGLLYISASWHLSQNFS